MNDLALPLSPYAAVFASPIAAKNALLEMERELDNAATYDALRRVEVFADTMRRLYFHVEEVRQQAERTIVIASERVGEELNKGPVAKGTRGQLAGRDSSSGAVTRKAPDATPTLAQQVGSQTRGLRLKKLAAAGREVVRATIAALHGAGKEASVSAVLKVLHGDGKKERRADRERELAAATIAASQELGTKLYGVIYADPPWRFEPRSRETGMDRAADNHYQTMTLDAIKALSVPAADDAVLFLWATVPMLPQALEVMGAWDFTYRSHFAWVKDRSGTGYWNRNRHELLLVGTRGKIPAPAPGEQYESVITAPVREHSVKPFEFHEIIEDMFPSLPRLEMFARGEPAGGWDRWGNEA